jgi:PAS domain S-box-containing protein
MPFRIGPSPEATIAIDSAGQIVAWNTAAEKLLGRSARDALGKPCHEIMHGLTPAGAPLCSPDCAVIGLCREGSAARNFEMVAQRPDGKEVWLDVATVTVQWDNGPMAVHVLTESISGKRLAVLAEEVTQRLVAKQPDVDNLDALRQMLTQTLTPREIEILRLVAAGIATDEIAERLSLARTTVRNHIQNIQTKLGAHSRLEAVVLALKAGLVHLH